MTKTLLPLLILLAVVGCNEKKAANLKVPITLVRSFQNTGNWDSVQLYSDGHLVITKHPEMVPDSLRYFLVTYKHKLKESNFVYDGNLIFSCHRYPSLHDIDSIVLSDMPYKKSCYVAPLINSIIEFENKQDFDDFSDRFPSQKHSKIKKQCE